MEDHVFSENKEIKKAKKFFVKYKAVAYVFFGSVLLLILALAATLLSGRKIQTSDVTKVTESTGQPGQYQVTTPTCNLDVQLVLDSSLSMRHLESDGRSKYVWAKEAMRGFINSMAARQAANSNNHIRVGLTDFGPNARLRSSLTTNLPSVLTTLNGLTIRSNSGTCISCALTAANDNIISLSTQAGTKKAVVLLSDGCGNRNSSGQTISIADARTLSTREANRGRGSGIEYFTVGYSNPGSSNCGTPQYNGQTLTEIANDPDSEHHMYRPNVTTWLNDFDELALDLCPPPPPDLLCSSKQAYSESGSLLASNAVIQRGQRFKYRVNYRNNSAVTATNAYVIDDLPTQLSFHSAVSGYNCYLDPDSGGRRVRCTMPSVAANASGYVEFWVTVNSTATYGSFENEAMVGPSNNSYGYSSCYVRLTVPSPTPTPGAQLTCESKQAYTSSGVLMSTGTVVQRGTSFKYRINYRNFSATAQTNATITDTLPSGINYVTNEVGDCTNNSNTVTCNLGTVAGNGYGYVQFSVTVSQNAVSGSKTNQGFVVPDYNPNNSGCTFSINVPTPTQMPYCATLKVNTVKDMAFGSPSACNGVVNFACSQDRVITQSYTYSIEYRNADGVIQPNLSQTGTVTSVNGDLCANPQNVGYSPEVRLTNMPAGGSARVTLTYINLPANGTRILATTNPNSTTTYSDDVIVIDNVVAGQAVSVRGHECITSNCGGACTTFAQSAPAVTRGTSTVSCL